MIPDVGPVVSAIADCSTTGAKSKVELVLGKPNTFACDFEPLKTLVAESTLMIGDNLETDIRFGKNGNFNTALVLTGHSTKSDLVNSTVQPDIVLNSVQDLLNT